MAALDFPSSPATNQIYSANGRSWKWDGTTWAGTPATSPSTMVTLHPDYPPTSPDTTNDEFDDTSGNSGTVNGLNARWGWQNQGSSSISYTNSCGVISFAAAAGNRLIEQTISGNGQWTCKVNKPSIAVDGGMHWLGFKVAASGKLMHVGLYEDNVGQAVAVQKYTNISTFSANALLETQVVYRYILRGDWIYLQVQYDGTTVYFRMSATGIPGTFATLFSEAATTFLGAAPTRLYIGGFTSTAVVGAGAYDWVRKTA